MKKFKSAWGITRNWQLVHPVLGVLLSLFFGYLISLRILSGFTVNDLPKLVLTIVFTGIFGYIFILLSLFFFKKLKGRWTVKARWQFIAIFIVFALTGSLAGRLSSPFMRFIGLGFEDTSGWLYWPLRIVIIVPIYQVLLLIIGWVFGQYKFFYAFERKMLSRMGLGFLLGEKQSEKD